MNTESAEDQLEDQVSDLENKELRDILLKHLERMKSIGAMARERTYRIGVTNNLLIRSRSARLASIKEVLNAE